jgi:CHAT domain-containing protein
MYYFVQVRVFNLKRLLFSFFIFCGISSPLLLTAQSKSTAADSIIDAYTQHYHKIAGSGDWKSALAIGKECLSLAEIKGADPKRISQLWFDLAYMCTENEQHDSAVHYYELAKTGFESVRDPDLQQLGLLYNNLAFAMDKLGRQQKKIGYYTKALEIWKTCEPHPIGNIHTVLGNLVEAHTEYGSFKEAKSYLEELNEQTAREYSAPNKRYTDFQFGGQCETRLAAIRYFAAVDSISYLKASMTEMEKMFKNAPVSRREAFLHYLLSAYETVGYTLKNQSHFDDAAYYYEMAGSRAKQPFYLMKAAANRAILEYDRQQFYPSLQYARKAISLIDTSWSGSSWYSLKVLEAELCLRLDQRNKSEAILMQLLSRLLRKPMSWHTIGTLTSSDLRGLASYNFIQVLTKAGQVVKELSGAENSKMKGSRNLFLLAADMFAEYYQEGQYNRYLDGLNRSIMEGLLSTQAAISETASDLQVIINKIENNATRHTWKKLLYRYQQDLIPDQKRILSDFKVEAIQIQLKPDQEILRYYVSDSSIFLLQISQQNLVLTRLGEKENLIEKTKLLHHRIAGLRPDYSELLTALSKSLLKPVLRDLNKIRQYIVVPDESLGFLPFEVLMTDKGKPLAYSHAVVYSYSLPLFHIHQQLGRNPEFRNRNKLIAFAPEYKTAQDGTESMAKRGEDLYQLEFATREAREITTIFNGILVNGMAADRNSFLEQLGSFDIYHLAMHAELDSISYESTNLIFSKDERLYFHELYQLDFPAEMVVLSACNTGIGAMEKGEGLMSLSHALSFAGVRSSVYSLWEVPDKETAEIITRFYQLLAEGFDKSVALQLAKKEFLDANPSKQHPYFWAGFIINGNSSPIVNGASRYWPWVIVSLLVISTGLFLRYYLLNRS